MRGRAYASRSASISTHCAIAVLVAIGLAACELPADDPPAGGGEGKQDRGGAPAFREVDPAHSSAAFRREVDRALTILGDSDAEVAQLTRRAILDGRVLIDELVDLTCWDFERARRDLTSVELASADWARLRDPGSDVAEAVTAELDGYMWSNRIYVSRDVEPRLLAATLVHEVNHVINRSEVGYYDDLPTSAFLHEYRAFYAERLFDPDRYDGIDLVAHVIALYELDRDRIRADVLEAPLTPRLLPDSAAWRARRVEDDPPDVEADCPGR